VQKKPISRAQPRIQVGFQCKTPGRRQRTPTAAADSEAYQGVLRTFLSILCSQPYSKYYPVDRSSFHQCDATEPSTRAQQRAPSTRAEARAPSPGAEQRTRTSPPISNSKLSTAVSYFAFSVNVNVSVRFDHYIQCMYLLLCFVHFNISMQNAAKKP
jgi:hypothetical protein